ncbi:hypothetical protein NL676_011951 [Syzygium grande]|nr:hypothetical protein NL676_011951 [Syzygium grande]
MHREARCCQKSEVKETDGGGSDWEAPPVLTGGGRRPSAVRPAYDRRVNSTLSLSLNNHKHRLKFVSLLLASCPSSSAPPLSLSSPHHVDLPQQRPCGAAGLSGRRSPLRSRRLEVAGRLGPPRMKPSSGASLS